MTPPPSSFWPRPLGKRERRQVPRIEPTASPPVHDHKHPRAPFVPLYAAIGILTLAVAMLLGFITWLGAHRDEQIQRTQEEIRVGMCDLLDTLPPSPLLDRDGGPRDKYGCGPGIPRSELPRELQRRLDGSTWFTQPKPGEVLEPGDPSKHSFLPVPLLGEPAP